MSTSTKRATPAWLVVARREIAVKVRDKGLIISTSVMVGMMLLAMGLSYFLGGQPENVKVAVTTEQGATLVRTADDAAGAAGAKVDYEYTKVADAAAVRDAVRTQDAELGLVQENGTWVLVSEKGAGPGELTWMQNAVATNALLTNAAAQKVDLAKLHAGTELKEETLGSSRVSGAAAMFAAMPFGMLFYLTSMFLGYALANGIIEEKQNRIVEVVASSVRIRDLLLGKVAGITLIAVAQVAVLALVGLAGLLAMGKGQLLRQITPSIGWYLAFFLVGIVVMASLFAASGSLASRPEDAQSVTTPVTSLSMLAFFGGIFAQGQMLKVLSFVPLVSTIAMPTRLLAENAAWWEPVVSLTLALVVGAVLLKVSERIYTRALLQTGRKMSWSQAWKAGD